jgi:hypothetical protein
MYLDIHEKDIIGSFTKVSQLFDYVIMNDVIRPEYPIELDTNSVRSLPSTID